MKSYTTYSFVSGSFSSKFLFVGFISVVSLVGSVSQGNVGSTGDFRGRQQVSFSKSWREDWKSKASERKNILITRHLKHSGKLSLMGAVIFPVEEEGKVLDVEILLRKGSSMDKSVES